MSVPVLIPVNRLDRAKGRLAALLSAEERTTLARITLETVLHAAGPASIVLTADPRVREAAAGKARVIAEAPGASGLNELLEAAIATLVKEGAVRDALLILHADLPLATGEAIEYLLSMGAANSIAAVESRDGGTNAMLMQPPAKFPLAYGAASFARHCAAARQAGMHVSVNANRELRLDLDTPEDVVELLRAPRGRQGASGRYLQSIGVEGRLSASG